MARSATVRNAMRDIDRAVEESIGTHEEYGAKKEGQSRRRVYEKSIEAVRDTAGTSEAARLTEWIETRIREDGDFPSGRRVHKRGAQICRDAGHSVSTNDWLGA